MPYTTALAGYQSTLYPRGESRGRCKKWHGAEGRPNGFGIDRIVGTSALLIYETPGSRELLARIPQMLRLGLTEL
jgi:hypothetical protein